MSATLVSDWSHLPSDLLLKIAGTSLSDCFRFRAVCHQWRRSVPKIPIPWFDLPNYSLEISIFVTPDNQRYKLHIPEAIYHTNYFCPSPYGWILPLYLFAPNQTLSLLNPITGSRFSLPPLAVPSPDHFRNCKLIAAAAGPHESDTTFSFLVVMIAIISNAILALRRRRNADESGEWTNICSCETVGDFTFHGGRYFVLDKVEEHNLKCMIIDVETNQEVSVIRWVTGESNKARYSFVPLRFLVESSSVKELYLVVLHLVDRREWFEVFRLNQTEKLMEWQQVRDIGKDVLFLDGYRGMALRASEVDGCRGNSIVFLGIPDPSLKENDACFSVYDIGNDRVEQLPVYWRSDPRIWRNYGWFVPKI